MKQNRVKVPLRDQTVFGLDTPPITWGWGHITGSKEYPPRNGWGWITF
jgi:hypothetical protein